jgi:hypothetical protein
MRINEYNLMRCCTILFLLLIMLWCGGWPVSTSAQEETGTTPQPETVLGHEKDRFTINGEPIFLLGISYYGALGASRESVQADLDDLRTAGFQWLRVWVTWEAFGENVSAVNHRGDLREPYFQRLRELIAECDRRHMIVDVTLARSRPGKREGGSVHLPDLAAHRRAVKNIIEGLAPYRNWYLDLANERDVGDDRFVSVEELTQLRDYAAMLQPNLLVTASFGGHDLSQDDIDDAVRRVKCDFLAIHRPRHAQSPQQTEQETRKVLQLLDSMQRRVPVHHQEPFRRGYADWEPVAEDFLTDLRGAVRGGAAGWCFHNGSTKYAEDQRPRRSFDLRNQRLMDQLDTEEMKVIAGVQQALRTP